MTIPLGRRRLPRSCRGKGWAGTVTGVPPMHCPAAPAGAARAGALVRGAAAKLNALVRSPVTLRRQPLRFGTSTPNRVSRKRRIEVWSNVSEPDGRPG